MTSDQDQDRLAAQITAQVKHLLTTCPACAERAERAQRAREAMPALTDRRLQVLARIAAGRTQDQIAEDLHLSTHTIKTHTQWLHDVFGVRSRADLVATAFRLGLVE